MNSRRGKTAGAAPYPGHPAVSTPLPDGAEVNGVTTNAEGTLEVSGRILTLDAFVALPIDGGVLSVVPGKYAHIHHDGGGTTFLRWAEGRWFVGHVEVVSRSSTAVASDEVPPQPTEITLVYTWLGEQFDEFSIVGRANGVCQINHMVLPPYTALALPSEPNVIHREEGSSVLCLMNTERAMVYKYVSGYGWYKVNTSPGKLESANDAFERFAWGPWMKLLVFLAVAVTFGGAIFLLFDTIIRLYFHPARLHMPKWFLQDNAEQYFEAEIVHKIIQASSDPFGYEDPPKPR